MSTYEGFRDLFEQTELSSKAAVSAEAMRFLNISLVFDRGRMKTRREASGSTHWADSVVATVFVCKTSLSAEGLASGDLCLGDKEACMRAFLSGRRSCCEYESLSGSRGRFSVVA